MKTALRDARVAAAVERGPLPPERLKLTKRLSMWPADQGTYGTPGRTELRAAYSKRGKRNVARRERQAANRARNGGSA